MNDPGLKRVRARLHVILLVVIEGTPYTCLLCLYHRSVTQQSAFVGQKRWSLLLFSKPSSHHLILVTVTSIQLFQLSNLSNCRSPCHRMLYVVSYVSQWADICLELWLCGLHSSRHFLIGREGWAYATLLATLGGKAFSGCWLVWIQIFFWFGLRRNDLPDAYSLVSDNWIITAYVVLYLVYTRVFSKLAQFLLIGSETPHVR